MKTRKRPWSLQRDEVDGQYILLLSILGEHFHLATLLFCIFFFSCTTTTLTSCNCLHSFDSPTLGCKCSSRAYRMSTYRLL
jgi:hypothetical protein